METNQEGNAEKFFKDFGKKLDQFMVELKDAGNRVEVDLKKKYEELKVASGKLSQDEENKKRWQELQNGLKRAGKELEDTLKTVFKKKT
jgi:hypothetical protein